MNLTDIANSTDLILLHPYSCGPGIKDSDYSDSANDAYRVPGLNNILRCLT